MNVMYAFDTIYANDLFDGVYLVKTVYWLSNHFESTTT